VALPSLSRFRACLDPGDPGRIRAFSPAKQNTGQTGPGQPTAPFGCIRGRDIWPFRDLSPGELSTGREVGNCFPGLLALSRDTGGGSGDTSASRSSPPVTERALPECFAQGCFPTALKLHSAAVLVSPTCTSLWSASPLRLQRWWSCSNPLALGLGM
jgi:hypothetical protein